MDEPPPPDDQAGWTLLELLVALGLMSLMTVLLTSSLYGARTGLRNLNEQSGASLVEAAQGYLRRAITQSYPARRPGVPVDGALLDGQRTSVRYVTAYGPAGQYGGLYAIELGILPGSRNGTFDLVEKRTLYRPAPQAGTPDPVRPETYSRLLENVENVTFRYLGQHVDQPATGWESEWSDSVSLPQLIAIDIGFSNGDRRRWPILIIALPLGR